MAGARQEGAQRPGELPHCDDMTVYLCEGYGLGYLGLPWAGPGGLEHPLRRGLDTTSATGPYSARTAGSGNLRDPGRDRAAEHYGPPAAGPFGTWATGGPRTLRAYAALPEALPAAGTHPGPGR